jgi:uncharacterized protein involved in response to NO
MTTSGYVLFVAFIVSPFLPLGFAISSVVRHRSVSKKSVLLLAALGALSAFAVAGFFLTSLVGPSYSIRRYTTIYTSLLAAIMLAIFAARQEHETSKSMFTSALLLVAVWVLHAAISSVV